MNDKDDNLLEFTLTHYENPYYKDSVEARLCHLLTLVREHEHYPNYLSLVEIKLSEALFWYAEYLEMIDEDNE